MSEELPGAGWLALLEGLLAAVRFEVVAAAVVVVVGLATVLLLLAHPSEPLRVALASARRRVGAIRDWSRRALTAAREFDLSDVLLVVGVAALVRGAWGLWGSDVGWMVGGGLVLAVALIRDLGALWAARPPDPPQ